MRRVLRHVHSEARQQMRRPARRQGDCVTLSLQRVDRAWRRLNSTAWCSGNSSCTHATCLRDVAAGERTGLTRTCGGNVSW
eukprot:6181035-Pleurochrysis_carterae.AAC.1